MKLRNKISRRAQFISAIAVALFFVGGWVAVWKWPHIRFRYHLWQATPAMQAAWSKSVTRLPISSGGWDQWDRIDLGVCSLCVPPGDIEVEAVGPTGVCIRMPTWQIDIPDLLLGRRLSAEAHAGGQLRLLSRNGKWRPVSFRSFRRRAHFATSADFRWSMSEDQVWELEQLLFFKAIHAQGMQGETQFVRHQHAEIVMTFSSKGDAASVWASPRDDRDSVVFNMHMRDRNAFTWGIFAAYSIRFPDRPFPAEGAALDRHIQSLVDTYRTKRIRCLSPLNPEELPRRSERLRAALR